MHGKRLRPRADCAPKARFERERERERGAAGWLGEGHWGFFAKRSMEMSNDITDL